MNNIEKLVKLINENPGIEVLPVVDLDVVGDGDYSRYGGAIGESRIDKYYSEDERIYFDDDYDDLEEEIQDRIWLDHQPISDEELEKLAGKEMDKLKWKKVIVVDIDTI